jgi:hypothetical protein
LLVFQRGDAGLARIDFMGQGAVFLVLFGLKLLQGVTLDLLLFGIHFQFEAFAL